MMGNRFEQVIDEFDASADTLREVAACVRYDIEQGLKGGFSSLQMLKSYIGLPQQTETGSYLAVDFGGTNVRTALVKLEGEGRYNIEKKVSKPLTFPGLYDYTSAGAKGSELFDFIAAMIDETIAGDRKEKYYLGHTFSFPCEQTDIHDAKLIKWTKEFATADVEGKKVNKLLKEALHRQGLDNVEPVAIINDTVAVLLAAAYQSPDTYIGSIYATGHNTAYFERSADDLPFPMIINLEIGGFNKLAVNKYDQIIDKASGAPYEQRLEKMVSGRYIGKLFSCCVQDLFDLDELPSFTSVDLSGVLNDEAQNFPSLTKLCTDRAKLTIKQEEAAALRELAAAIIKRSARLAAAAYCGILWHLFPQSLSEQKIFIDGSLFEKVPGIKNNMYQGFSEVLGEEAGKIKLELESGGSILGAAAAAAMSK